jgi:hypothetical protein
MIVGFGVLTMCTSDLDMELVGDGLEVFLLDA